MWELIFQIALYIFASIGLATVVGLAWIVITNLIHPRPPLEDGQKKVQKEYESAYFRLKTKLRTNPRKKVITLLNEVVEAKISAYLIPRSEAEELTLYLMDRMTEEFGYQFTTEQRLEASPDYQIQKSLEGR